MTNDSSTLRKRVERGGSRRSAIGRMLLGGILASIVVSAGQAQTIVQEFYVPLPEEQVRSTLLKLYASTGPTFDSVVSVVLNSAGTRVAYDHWEDGYEISLDNPTQSTTKVWGDGNDANGIAPGFANDPTNLAAGTVFALRNFVALPRVPTSILYDGRDRLGATKAMVVSRAAWATSPGSVLAGAAEVSSVLDFGTVFISPVGEDVSAASMFEVVDLFVMASENNTSVSIDKDANGSFETVTTLNRGESYRVNGGVLKGARINASKPVQAHILTGDIGANYESRWMTLYPFDQWSSIYYTPVGTAADGDQAYVFIYNPGTSSLPIQVTTQVGSTNFTVSTNGSYQYQVPLNSGAKFQSTNGLPFFAVETVGANPTANNVHDWGFTLVPEGNLTPIAVVGWGPGSSDLSQNGSPVWVTAVGDATIYVDYNGDRAGPFTDSNGDGYDVATNVVALQSVRLYDPDKDQTAMRVYTLDGTLITAAWGQDPAVAGAGNPFLDLGTTVLPFPQAVIRKTSSLVTDNPPSGISTNDILEYAITIDNNSVVVLGNVVVLDSPPPSLSYVTNTSLHDAAPVSDSVVPPALTPFPFDESGYVIPIIPRGGSTVLKYRTLVLASGTIANGASIGGTSVTVTNVVTVPGPTGSNPCTLDFTDGSGNAVASYAAGAGIFVTLRDADANASTTAVNTVSVTVQDPSSGDLETITLTELSVNTNVFRNSSALPSSTIAGVAQQDGTLYVAPGHTLSVTYTDPVYGDICSDTATVSSPSAIKILYLSTDGVGSPDQDLDRVDPVATADASTATSVVFAVDSGNISLENVSTVNSNEASAALATISVAHVTSNSANRLMLAGISFEDDNTLTLNVTNLRYIVGATTQSFTRVIQRASGEAASEIWRLIGPTVGTGTVIASVSGGTADSDEFVLGVASFSGVDQATPLTSSNGNTGTTSPSSVIVTSAVGELVFDTLALDDARTATAAAGQTQRWSLISGTADSDGIRAAASTKAGSNTVTMSWTIAADNWAISGVSIKPSALGTNQTTFTQTPALCANLSLPAGGTVSITNALAVTSGSMPTNPAITARLLYGTNVFATITNPVFNASNSNLTWTTVLPAATNIPSGQAINFEVTSAQTGVVFAILYDSLSRPSKINLPTTSIIDVNALGVYDAPYPGGSLVSVANNGNTLYVRSTVSDPFGSYDITSLGLVIDASGTVSDVSTTLSNVNVVASNSCTKTYEYVWVTGITEGNYTIAVTANEGTEGITDTAATSINLSFLDLGTPCATAFTLGNNGPVTNRFGTNVTICVRVTDLDQNTNALAIDTVPVVLTTSIGDTEPLTLLETTTNSGIFTACISATNLPSFTGTNGVLSAPAGSSVTLNYVDPDDSSDPCSTVATVPPAAGIPGLSLTKTLLSPADGQAVIGEAVQFRLRAINTGSTALNPITLTDSFPSVSLTYVSASPSPNTVGAGLLTWTNIGPLAPGSSADVIVNFTALAVANQATNTGIANAGGGTVATGRAPVLITRPLVTVNKSLTSPIPGPVNKGSNVVFSIALTNTGTTAISTLPLEDLFSGACLTFVSANPSPDASGYGSLLWNDLTGAGSLAAGGSITVSVTFVALGGCNPAENFSPVSYAIDVFGDPVPPVTSMSSITTLAARITGTVYNDPDRSGTLTGGDTGLSAVTVQLFTDPNGDGDPADGSLVDVTSTSTNGTYEFLNLGAGNYVVVETDPLSYVSMGDTSGANDNRIPVVINTLTTYAGNDFFDTQFPSIAVQKRVNGAELATGTNGTVVTYSFVVSNPGSLTLTNISLSDPLISYATNIGSLIIGQSATVTVAGTISADLTNSVTATGQYFGTGTVSGVDTAIVDRINPLITIANTVGTGAFPGGEVAQGTNGTAVTYWFVVQNAGDVTLTNVAVTNNVLGSFQSVGTLAAGQIVTVSVNSTISADLTNSAVATGFDPLGNPTMANDPSAVDLIAPAISVAKTVNGVELVQGTNGAPVTYSFVINNTGDVTLTNVVLMDPLLLFTNNVGPLTAGQSVTVTTARTISSDLTNTASVAGDPPVGPPTTGSDTAVVDRINPLINIEDTVSANGTCPGVELVQGTNGTAVTYCFIVSNAGDVTLTNVVVTNAALGFAQSVGTLTAGQVVTVSVAGVISGDLVNTAVATGFDPVGNPTSDNDPSEVDLIAPAINIEDTVSTAGTCPGVELVQGIGGTPVTYCFVVSNIGDVALTNVVVTNSVLGFTQNIGSLAVGQVVTVSVAGVISADLVNTAVATGSDPVGGEVSDSDSSAVDLIAPSVDVAKSILSPAGRSALVGEDIEFAISVTNTGDITLDFVPVTDTYETNLLTFVSANPSQDLALAGMVVWSNVGPLAVGGSTVITSRFTTLAGGIGTNVVLVSPTLTNSVPVPPATSSVPHEASTIGIAIDKLAATGSCVCAGGLLSFSVTVTNAGTAAITNISVVDLDYAAGDAALGTLAAGATTSYVFSVTVAGESNRIYATGESLGFAVSNSAISTWTLDTTSPTLVGLPANETNECDAISAPAMVTATDDCDAVVPVSFSATTNGSCPSIISRVWSAADDCGNSVAATQLVTVVDTTAPSLVGFPVDETNECDSVSAPAVVTATDACDASVPVSFSATTNGSCPSVISRVWSAADDCGNSVAATQLVTVVDTTAPTLVGFPVDETNECDSVSSPASVTATDNCDTVVPVSFSAATNGSCPSVISRVWSAADDCGNSVAATQLVTVVDTTAPNLVGFPVDETNECDSVSSPASVTATDNCDTVVPVSFSATTNGSCPSVISRVWSASDDCGNNVAATQLVTVVDTTAPSLVGLPVYETNECDSISSPASVTATDNCDASVPVSFSATTNGSCPSVISRVWSAADDCGNSVAATQLVTVVDTTAPNLVGFPVDETNECDSVSSPASVTATDNCDTVVPVSFSAATNGSCPSVISRVWSATDDCGNSVAATQLVTVVDTTAPSLVGFPVDETNECDSISSPASVTATDNCDTVVPVSFSAMTNGSCPSIISRVWSASDDCGNSVAATQLVTVVDTTAPSLVGFPVDETNECDSISSPASVTATDNCDTSVPVSFSATTNGSCPSVISRVWSASDDCGNSVAATQLVTVVDTTAPSLVGFPVDETNECDSVGAPAVVTATDNCDLSVPVSFSATTNGSCPSIISRVWSASDDCGNNVAATQLVTVVDTTAPSLVGVPLNATNECDNVSAPAIVTATDACDASVPVVFAQTTNAGACADSYDLVRRWSGTDLCGNQSVATQILSVVDQTAPLLTLPTNVVIGSDSLCQAQIPSISASAVDGCTASPSISIVQTPLAGTPVAGPSTTLVEVVATDLCGNSSTGQVPVIVTCVLASIGDFVWEDINGNGLQDAGETGLVGVAMALYNGAGTLVAVTNTDVNGYYAFTNRLPGLYHVGLTALPGYSVTFQDQGTNDAIDSDADTLTGHMATNLLTSGENDTSWDGGLFRRASFGDFVWHDANRNGIQNGGEVGLTNVEVTLYDLSTNVLGVTTSGVGGVYGFANLAPGSYFLGFGPAPGFIWTLQDQGGNDAVDSDVSPVTGRTPPLALLSGQNNTTVDAGYSVPSSVRIDKSPDFQLIVSGSSATFSITVTNDGPTTLTNVFVSDPLGVACGRNIGTLLFGASTSYVCTVPAITANFTNRASVAGYDPFGNQVSDTNDAEVQVIHPSILIFKGPILQQVTNGDSAVFTITVTNNGDVVLTNVVVSDPSAPQCNNNGIGTLLAGQSVSYNCSVLNVTQSFANVACASGYNPLGGLHSSCDQADVAVLSPVRDGCTRTVNFWYCHTNSWPASGLVLGNTSYSQSNLMVIFSTSNPTDVTWRVAKELGAAKLNAFAGADISIVAQAMADADQYLIDYPLGSTPQGAAATTGQTLADLLLSYNNGTIGPGACFAPAAVDFDGDFVSDISVYWPTKGRWFARRSTTGTLIKDFGWSAAVPIAADYDGDRRSDIAVYYPGSGTWYVYKSDTFQIRIINWGWSESIPVPADYDGDGYEDLAVYHPGSGNWYIRESSDKSVARVQNWGFSQTVPVPGDYDGDHVADIAVYHPQSGNWYIRKSTTGTAMVQNWGYLGAMPVPADYDGDGLTDIAVHNPTTGKWSIRRSSDGQLLQANWGYSQTTPVPADYDGDGLADITVFHRTTGTWYIRRSETGAVWTQNWGWSEVIPVLPQWTINHWMNSRLGLWPGQ